MAAQWMLVVLTVLLTEPILAVDQNRLSLIVDGIVAQYGTQGMWSLAVSVPGNVDNVNLALRQIVQSDNPVNVRNTFNNNGVYRGNRVVAAKRLGTDHAESRVVDYLNHLFNNNNRNDLLIFYVYASPCVEKCSSNTHTQSILSRIRSIDRWSDWAVVFSTIFRPQTGPGNTDQERTAALLRLGGVVGLDRVFRCGPRQCVRCFTYGQVANYCVSG